MSGPLRLELCKQVPRGQKPPGIPPAAQPGSVRRLGRRGLGAQRRVAGLSGPVGDHTFTCCTGLVLERRASSFQGRLLASAGAYLA